MGQQLKNRYAEDVRLAKQGCREQDRHQKRLTSPPQYPGSQQCVVERYQGCSAPHQPGYAPRRRPPPVQVVFDWMYGLSLYEAIQKLSGGDGGVDGAHEILAPESEQDPG